MFSGFGDFSLSYIARLLGFGRSEIERAEPAVTEDKCHVGIYGASVSWLSSDDIEAALDDVCKVTSYAMPGATASDRVDAVIEAIIPGNPQFWKEQSDWMAMLDDGQKHGVDIAIISLGGLAGNKALEGANLDEISSLEKKLQSYIDAAQERGMKVVGIGLNLDTLQKTIEMREIPPEYVEAMTAMFERIEHANPKVVFAPALFEGLDVATDFVDSAHVTGLANDPRGYVEYTVDSVLEKAIAWVDYFQDRAHIHPNQSGQHKIAENIDEAVRTVLYQEALTAERQHTSPTRNPHEDPIMPHDADDQIIGSLAPTPIIAAVQMERPQLAV